jgi:hypothetical protein
LKQALFVMAAAPEVDLIVQDHSAACQLSFLRDKQTARLGEAVVLGAIVILAWTHPALLPSPLLCPQSWPLALLSYLAILALAQPLYIHTAVQQQRCFLPTPSLLQDLVFT